MSNVYHNIDERLLSIRVERILEHSFHAILCIINVTRVQSAESQSKTSHQAKSRESDQRDKSGCGHLPPHSKV
jgi:hypothetical protein